MNAIKIIKPTIASRHTGTVIFLHGSGGTGTFMKRLVQKVKPDFAFPHLKSIFPTAPLRPYTPLNGNESNVWFDRVQISPDCPDDLETLNASSEDLKRLIQQEINSGIPIERVVIGGFSMGGAMALHMGYRIVPNVTGVFALSSFLHENSTVYQELAKKKYEKLPPLFYTQGDKDDTVWLSWAQQTFHQLQKLGVRGQFTIKQNTLHEVKPEEIISLWDWITDRIPET